MVNWKAILPNEDEVSAQGFGFRYYGTDRIDPERAFELGIPVKGPDRRLKQHLDGNNSSAFRGTTESPIINMAMGQGAAAWAGEGGWVYYIGRVLGWDPSQLLEGRVANIGGYLDSPTMSELEISIPSLIPPAQIVKAGIVIRSRSRNFMVRGWIENPNYIALT